MSAKIVFDTKEEIREDLRDKAKEVDGKFELDAKGVLDKNTELLGKNSTLTYKVEELDSTVTELKKSSKIPAGQKIVAENVAELGEAALAAGLVKDEMPTLKSSKDDLQKKIDGYENEKVVSEVAAANGFNNRFVLAAKDKGLKFEKSIEKVDGKDIDVWNILGADNSKTKVKDFLESDAYFKEFADTFTDAGTGKAYPPQTSDKSKVAPVAGVAAVKQKLNSRYADAPATQK